jgi:hypothetical protein
MGSIPIPSSTDEPLYSDVGAFLWELKKRGYKDSTIVENYAKILKHLLRNCSLNNPESVLAYVATRDVCDGRKELMIDCYSTYCLWKKIPFSKPRYRRQDKLPYVPLEKDIEALLGTLPPKSGTFTRCLFETGARPGEMFNLK